MKNVKVGKEKSRGVSGYRRPRKWRREMGGLKPPIMPAFYKHFIYSVPRPDNLPI